MLAKNLKRSGFGFLIGIVIGDLIALITGNSSTGGVTLATKQLLDMAGGNSVIAMLLQSFFSGLYGALCFAGMSLYEMERLPLAAATALHCAIIVIFYIPIALLLGWVSGIAEILVVAGIQIVVFFIIWLIMYFAYRKQVRELNELTRKKSSETKAGE